MRLERRHVGLWTLLPLFWWCGGGEADPQAAPTFDIKPEYEFSRGVGYYRLLQLDEQSNSIYVGAMNHLYKLWMFNVNDTQNTAFYADKELRPSADSLTGCAYRSSDVEFACQNHIRLVVHLPNTGATAGSPSKLYVCGTNAFSPQVLLLDAHTLKEVDQKRNGAAVCPVHPDDRGAAVWAESGNPGGVGSIYSATVTDFTQTSRIIYRPPIKTDDGKRYPFMRTMHTDNKWLDNPEFVGAFDIGEYVYFFFRENAVELTQCASGPAVYSRVARICKNDVGGKHVLRQNWSSFVKLRLNCSLPGTYPFYFDHIRSVSLIRPDSKSTYPDDFTFYAAFSTPKSYGQFSGAAICKFELAQIDSVFDRGTFLEQVSATAAWLPLSNSRIPERRPGKCVPDSLSLSDTALHFARSHMFMEQAVAPKTDRPMQIIPGGAVPSFVVVDRLDAHDRQFVMLFVATDNGRIHKIAEWVGDDGRRTSRLVATYKLPNEQPISALQILKNEFLYTGQDAAVSQLSVHQCHAYRSCAPCTADPYCSWNLQRGTCRRAHHSHLYTTGWIPSVGSSPRGSEQCSSPSPSSAQQSPLSPHAAAAPKRLVLYPGDSAHLPPCLRRGTNEGGAAAGSWLKDGTSLQQSEDVLLTRDGGVVVLNASSTSGGLYECGQWSSNSASRQALSATELVVDGVNCRKPQSVAAFAAAYKEWCREFQLYKHTMRKWHDWYEQNSHCANAPHFKQLRSDFDKAQHTGMDALGDHNTNAIVGR